MIVHLVLFNPKPEASPESLRSFARTIHESCRRIPSIERVRIGRKTTFDAGYARSFGDQTYRYVAILEFGDEDGLKQYLTHPLHAELGRMFWENCESTVVVEARAMDGTADGVVEFLLKDLV
jgi:hypothetical protein